MAPQLGTIGVVGVDGLKRVRNAVQRENGSDLAPGARLHVLVIGISDYGTAASHLNLAYADQDARDVASALRNSQNSLYAQIFISELVNDEATKADIIRELGNIRDSMQTGGATMWR